MTYAGSYRCPSRCHSPQTDKLLPGVSLAKHLDEVHASVAKQVLVVIPEADAGIWIKRHVLDGPRCLRSYQQVPEVA